VEHLADLDAAVGQLGPGRLDVVHDEVQALGGGSRRGVVTPVPKMIEAGDRAGSAAPPGSRPHR